MTGCEEITDPMEIMNPLRKARADSRGFTLVEVIAVLIVLGIIVAVAASRISIRGDLASQTDIVKSHLRFVQLKAMADDTATWGISFSGSAYTLSYNHASSTLNLPGEDSNSHTFPPAVTTTSQAIDFDAWGNPSGGTAAVSLSGEGTSKTVTINGSTGFISP
jgi:MSHA pilin protein MshC